jgi:hypothetical protein
VVAVSILFDKGIAPIQLSISRSVKEWLGPFTVIMQISPSGYYALFMHKQMSDQLKNLLYISYGTYPGNTCSSRI